MSTAAEIADTITARMAAVEAELAALHSARAALTARVPSGSPIENTRERRETAQVRRRVGAEHVIALLHAAHGGLSATALAQQAGASAAQLGTRLKELEQAGLVRSTGQRRARRWHPVRTGPLTSA